MTTTASAPLRRIFPAAQPLATPKGEALTELDEAIEAWIAAAANAGNPIPHPSKMPALG
jgi:hypothetical protein